jgi:hypothetical protein
MLIQIVRCFGHTSGSPIRYVVFITSSPFVHCRRDISRKGGSYHKAFPHMAMQKPKTDPKNHVHWSLSTQMERMEMLVLPQRQQSTLHAKMQQLPNFLTGVVPTPRLPLAACVSNQVDLGLGSLLGIDASLLAHSSEDDDVW